jgi:hypothetical protein
VELIRSSEVTEDESPELGWRWERRWSGIDWRCHSQGCDSISPLRPSPRGLYKEIQKRGSRVGIGEPELCIGESEFLYGRISWGAWTCERSWDARWEYKGWRGLWNPAVGFEAMRPSFTLGANAEPRVLSIGPDCVAQSCREVSGGTEDPHPDGLSQIKQLVCFCDGPW